MTYKKIYLNSEDNRVFIDAYIADGAPRDAILIIPGGGYSNICADREGEPIAHNFVAGGYNAFVLGYRVSEADVYPAQLIDAASAMIYIRENAEALCVNRERVFAVGFSAGGHLAGCLATMFARDELAAVFGDKSGLIRPTGVILSYPVTTANAATHQGSFERISGKPFSEITDEEKRALSLDCAVSSASSPMFVWHTRPDTVVPVIGTLKLAEALVSNGVNFRLSIYPEGPHGTALANAITECGNPAWVQPQAVRWAEDAREFFASLPSDKIE